MAEQLFRTTFLSDAFWQGDDTIHKHTNSRMSQFLQTSNGLIAKSCHEWKTAISQSGHSVSSRNKGSSVTGRVEKTVHGKLGGYLEKPKKLNSQAMPQWWYPICCYSAHRAGNDRQINRNYRLCLHSLQASMTKATIKVASAGDNLFFWGLARFQVGIVSLRVFIVTTTLINFAGWFSNWLWAWFKCHKIFPWY